MDVRRREVMVDVGRRDVTVDVGRREVTVEVEEKGSDSGSGGKGPAKEKHTIVWYNNVTIIIVHVY